MIAEVVVNPTTTRSRPWPKYVLVDYITCIIERMNFICIHWNKDKWCWIAKNMKILQKIYIRLHSNAKCLTKVVTNSYCFKMTNIFVSSRAFFNMYVWKFNPMVLELDFWPDHILFSLDGFEPTHAIDAMQHQSLSYIADVWPCGLVRLDIRLSNRRYCVSMVWVQIPSRENNIFLGIYFINFGKWTVPHYLLLFI